MKKILTSISVIILMVSATTIIFGCASTNIKHLSGTEFLEQAKQTELLTSFNWTSYIGTGNSRVYLEYGYPAFIGDGYRTTVYWTELSELPVSIAKQLKEGKRPWENKEERIGQPVK